MTMPALHTTRVSLFARIGENSTDPRAWSEFVETYVPTLVQWCRQHGLQESDAHDVAQDVLVRFWRQATKFRYDPARRFRSYLRKMVLTAVADWSESRRADRLATAREDLAARIERAFDTERLSIAMVEVEQRVKPSTWAAFQLLAIDRLPGKEVADRLGIDVNLAYNARLNVQRMISDTLRRDDSAPR